ncbi:MAG TPA: helix-turn-helix transcriptional regulator, partial [Ktedonobacteraceae bacterium]
LLAQSRMSHGQDQQQMFQRVLSLCEQARTIFLQHGMQRAVDLVDTLQEGVRQLEQREKTRTTEQVNMPFQLTHTKDQLQAKNTAGELGYHLDLSLTRREQEVLRLVAEGHTDREVAEILVISPRTVNRHLSNMYVKLDVPGRAGAVAYAIRQGLV